MIQIAEHAMADQQDVDVTLVFGPMIFGMMLGGAMSRGRGGPNGVSPAMRSGTRGMGSTYAGAPGMYPGMRPGARGIGGPRMANRYTYVPTSRYPMY